MSDIRLKTIHLTQAPAPYSLPQEALTYKPLESDIKTVFKNGDAERKTYTYTELTEAEKKNIAEYRAKAAKENWKAMDEVLDPRLLRYLSHARGNIDKCYKCLCETAAFREDFFKEPIKDTDIKKYLDSGFCYIGGRDQGLRPLLVIRLERADPAWEKQQVLKMFCFICEYLHNFMYVGGTVESNVVLIDLANTGVSSFPFGLIKAVISCLSHHYVGRLYRLCIVNAGWVITGFYNNVVKPLLTDRQQNKITFISDAGPKGPIAQMFAPHQLEQQYGGTRPTIKQFYPLPLLPGPFDPSAKGPDSKARENCHVILCDQVRCAKLWEGDQRPARVWAAGSYKVWQDLGLPVPPPEQFLDGKNCDEAAAPDSRPSEPKPEPKPEAKPEPAPAPAPAPVVETKPEPVILDTPAATVDTLQGLNLDKPEPATEMGMIESANIRPAAGGGFWGSCMCCTGGSQ